MADSDPDVDEHCSIAYHHNPHVFVGFIVKLIRNGAFRHKLKVSAKLS